MRFSNSRLIVSRRAGLEDYFADSGGCEIVFKLTTAGYKADPTATLFVFFAGVKGQRPDIPVNFSKPLKIRRTEQPSA